MSLQTIYKYYGSKEPLLFASLDAWLDKLAARMIDHLQGLSDYKEKLRKVFWVGNRDFKRPFFAKRESSAGLVSCQAYVVRGLESGHFRALHRSESHVRGSFGVSGERGPRGRVGSGAEPDGAAPVGATLNTRTCHSCVSICPMTQPQNSSSSSTTKQWPVVFNQKGRDGGPNNAPPTTVRPLRAASISASVMMYREGPGLAPSGTRNAEAPEVVLARRVRDHRRGPGQTAKDDMVAIWAGSRSRHGRAGTACSARASRCLVDSIQSARTLRAPKAPKAGHEQAAELP